MTDLTRQLQGREIAAVLCNGTTVVIQTHCGAEIAIKWVDDNGRPIRGKPVIGSKGFRLRTSDLHDMIHLPSLAN